MLNRITSQRKKRDFLVYDMEWIPGKLEIRLVGVYDGHRYRAFYSVEDFLNALLTRDNADKWFYAHYGGMADAQFLLEYLVKHRGTYEIDASFSGSSAIIIHVTRGALTWHFIDSFWLLRDRLAKIGETVGLEKLGEEYICDNFPECGHVDYHQARYLDPGDPNCKHEWDEDGGECIKCSKEMSHPMCVFWAPMGELKIYNERDCVILHKAIAQFEDTLMQLGGQLQMTIASCAMHLFRRKYLQSDIRTNAAVNAWARLAYTSSRVEVFQTHCHNASYYDLNSSFPYAMTFPCPGNVKRLRDKKLPKYGNIYLAECEVQVPQMYLPPLPYRYDGRVFFPIGSWRSWFSNLDLELLEKRGGKILKVYQSIEFEQQTSLTDYAVDIYEKRKASKTPFEKLVFKYLLNSLYGKFGERTEKTSMILDAGSNMSCPHTPKHRCDSWPNCVHAIAGNECNNCLQPLFPGCTLVTNEAELSHEWVPIAVHITARARANLEGHLWNAQEDIYYCDSISSDRTVVLKSPDDRVVIRPVEKVWESIGADVAATNERGKEFLSPDGWQALAMDKSGKEGWFPLKRLIRHRVNKTMWRISNKDGQTEVTRDHGLMMSASSSVTPSEFVEAGANFVSLHARPSTRVGEQIDLWEFVKDFRVASRKSGPHGGPLVRQFVREGGMIVLHGLNGSGPTTLAKFRRYYKPGSSDFHALLRVLGAYLSEGSSSIRGLTTSRDLLTISQNSKPWLDKLATELRVVAPEGRFDVIPTGGGMWAIRAGSAPFACFFAALAGYRSSGKRLPSFAYDLSKADMLVLWTKLMEGDGHETPSTGEDTYTTKSQELAAGLSYLLSQHGLEHRTMFREDKSVWSLGTRPEGSSRNRKKTKVEVREPSEAEWVYDLSVDGANTFVDGMGRVLLHNTDSVITTVGLPSDPKTLGALKLEDTIESGEFIACKIYAVDVHRDETFMKKHPDAKPSHWKTKAKGFSRMNYKKFCDVKIGEEIKIARMTRIRELYRKGQTVPEENIVGKKLVQKCMPKRCMLPGGQSRPWLIEEIEENYMRTDVGIEPVRLADE